MRVFESHMNSFEMHSISSAAIYSMNGWPNINSKTKLLEHKICALRCAEHFSFIFRLPFGRVEPTIGEDSRNKKEFFESYDRGKGAKLYKRWRKPPGQFCCCNEIGQWLFRNDHFMPLEIEIDANILSQLQKRKKIEI